jgi:hypothetical protein
MFYGLPIASQLSTSPKLAPNTFVKITSVTYSADSRKDKADLYVIKGEQEMFLASMTMAKNLVQLNFKFSQDDDLKFLKKGSGKMYLIGEMKKMEQSTTFCQPKEMKMDQLYKMRERIKKVKLMKSLKNSGKQNRRSIKKLDANQILEISTDSENEKDYMSVNNTNFKLISTKKDSVKEKEKSYSKKMVDLNHCIKSTTTRKNKTCEKEIFNVSPIQPIQKDKDKFSPEIDKIAENESKPINKIEEKTEAKNEPLTKDQIKNNDDINDKNNNKESEEKDENTNKPENEGLIDDEHKDDFEGMEEDSVEKQNRTKTVELKKSNQKNQEKIQTILSMSNKSKSSSVQVKKHKNMNYFNNSAKIKLIENKFNNQVSKKKNKKNLDKSPLLGKRSSSANGTKILKKRGKKKKSKLIVNSNDNSKSVKKKSRRSSRRNRKK